MSDLEIRWIFKLFSLFNSFFGLISSFTMLDKNDNNMNCETSGSISSKRVRDRVSAKKKLNKNICYNFFLNGLIKPHQTHFTEFSYLYSFWREIFFSMQKLVLRWRKWNLFLGRSDLCQKLQTRLKLSCIFFCIDNS